MFNLCRSFSTGYSSVHGERPSAEYAKLRKESLETEFGHVLGARSKRVSVLYDFGPFLAFYRAAVVSFHVLKLAVWRCFIHDIKKRSVMVIFLPLHDLFCCFCIFLLEIKTVWGIILNLLLWVCGEMPWNLKKYQSLWILFLQEDLLAMEFHFFLFILIYI